MTFQKIDRERHKPKRILASKNEKMFFFHFHSKKPSNIISKFNDDFSEDFFEVLHISVGQKMKILETPPDFLTFSAKTQNRF